MMESKRFLNLIKGYKRAVCDGVWKMPEAKIALNFELNHLLKQGKVSLKVARYLNRKILSL